MSFLKRLVLSLLLLLLLLLFLGLPLSARYYESAQSLPSQADEDQTAQQDDGAPAGEEAPGVPVAPEQQEEQTG